MTKVVPATPAVWSLPAASHALRAWPSAELMARPGNAYGSPTIELPFASLFVMTKPTAPCPATLTDFCHRDR